MRISIQVRITQCRVFIVRHGVFGLNNRNRRHTLIEQRLLHVFTLRSLFRVLPNGHHTQVVQLMCAITGTKGLLTVLLNVARRLNRELTKVAGHLRLTRCNLVHAAVRQAERHVSTDNRHQVRININKANSARRQNQTILLVINVGGRRAARDVRVRQIKFGQLMQRDRTRTRRIIRVTTHMVKMRRQLVTAATRSMQRGHANLNRSSLNNLVGLIIIEGVNNIQMRHNRHVSNKNGRTRQIDKTQRQARRNARIFTGRHLIVSIHARLLVLDPTQRLTITRRPHRLRGVKILTRLLSKMATMTRGQVLTISMNSFQFTLHNNRRSKVGHCPTVITRFKGSSTVQPYADLGRKRIRLIQVSVGLYHYRSHAFLFVGRLPRALAFAHSQALIFNALYLLYCH